jgi:hypothetical protein
MGRRSGPITWDRDGAGQAVCAAISPITGHLDGEPGQAVWARYQTTDQWQAPATMVRTCQTSW